MPYETGTATDHDDLLARLNTFITGGSMGGDAWTTNRYVAGDELWIEGPGLTGSEEIHVGIQVNEDAGSDYFNWRIRVALGYEAANDYTAMPGTSASVWMLLWDGSIDYWFIANGQRLIVIAKVSTTYHMMYAGKFNPYGTPAQYPLPLFVGSESHLSTHRWSDTGGDVRFFVDPDTSNAYVMTPGNSWRDVANRSNGTVTSSTEVNTWPYHGNVSYDWFQALRDLPGSEGFVLPIMLHHHQNGKNILGELDGVFATSGFGLASEDLIEQGVDDYLVVQNVFRTNREDYCAVKLE